ncbi:pyrophosphohydrolase domain-containing protein [Metabacillus sp. SLBN-84]
MMVTSKWVNQHLNADQIQWRSVKGEFAELIQAIQTQNKQEIQEEIADVLYFTYCFLQGKFGINLPMLGAMPTVKKIIGRLDVWKEIFAERGLNFEVRYLVGGSNYHKKSKVNKAIGMTNRNT